MQLNICLIHANLIASTFWALPHGYLALGTACKKALPHFKSTEIYPLGPEVGLLVSHSQISQSWTSNYICLMAINILSFFLSRTLLFPHSLFPSSFLPFWLSFFSFFHLLSISLFSSGHETLHIAVSFGRFVGP